MSDPQDTVAVTEKALAKVKSFRAGVADADEQAMWVDVTGVARGEFTYDMALKPLAEAPPGAAVQRHEDLAVVIPPDSIEALRGATIDWSDDLMAGGLFLINPNRPSPAVGVHAGGGELSGPVADRVRQIIEQQINPAIAMHGGSAELVAVEDGAAYLRLGGGCVGCGMASVTLTQGIEVAITEAVPEVQRVIDVTDHAAGTNPYYEAAKK